MAERNEQVMEMVVRELARNPTVELDTLFERAKEIDPAVGDLSLRQFHARYPLQAKRIRAQERSKKTKRTTTAAKPSRGQRSRATPSREAIRTIFLEFASDFAQAESRPQIVKVLSNVDEYVDRVEALMARPD